LILKGGSGPTPEAPYFQVYRNTTNASAGATKLADFLSGSPYDDTSAVAGTTYYYWVKACNSAGCSGFSASDTGYRASGTTPPSAPTGVSASDGSFIDKVQVSWSASAGATYYQVFRHTSNNSSSATTLTGSHPSSPYDDTSAVAGTTYYYWVKACNSAGCSGFSSSDSGYRATEVTTPSPPTGVSASDGTYTDKVQISWTASAGATHYQVFRYTSNNSSSATSLTSSHSSSPYDDTSAVAGTTYYYWVKACNSVGCSGFSASDSGWRLTSTLANGDFEAGRDGSWTEYSSHGWDLIVHQTQTPVSAAGGEWLAWLGGEYDDTSRLSQTVTISASQPYLHFAYWIASEDYCAYDYAHVKINSTTVLTFDLCEAENTGGWNNYWINLSAYAGSPVTLMFEVNTDSSLNSNFFLDNVSLSSSSTDPIVEPNQGQDLSGVTLDKHHFEGFK